MSASFPTALLFRNGTDAAYVPKARLTAHQLGVLTAAECGPREALQLITTRAGFEALEADWNTLFEKVGRGDQMFQTFNWLWHWSNHFLPKTDEPLAIVTVRHDGALVAVLPFVTERVAGLKQLVFMGAPVSQYGDALVANVTNPDDLLARALSFAVRETKTDLLRLAKVRDDALLAPALRGLNAQITATEEAPFTNLATAQSFASYDTRFSTKARKNRRRLERRLAEHGAVVFTPKVEGADAAHAARTTMVLKRAWLKTRGQLSRAFADTRTDAFFADVCQGTTRPAGAHVSLLTAGGEMANMAIIVSAKGRQALHILAYGLKFEKCAAGVLHAEKLIERAFADGVTTLDFLAPRHEYKLEWADGVIAVRDYALPVSLAGKAYTRVYLGVVREHLKAAARAAPRTLARPMALLQSAMKAVRR